MQSFHIDSMLVEQNAWTIADSQRVRESEKQGWGNHIIYGLMVLFRMVVVLSNAILFIMMCAVFDKWRQLKPQHGTSLIYGQVTNLAYMTGVSALHGTLLLPGYCQ